ncbi:Uncharacterised protein [Burkholderia pseudomallei]|nr:Uncharacterised protein [Burkholderia pseudomallei]
MATQRLRLATLAGHYDFHHATFVIRIVPLRSQYFYCFVQTRGDVPAHSHNHRLAFHSSTALFPVLNDESGHALESLWRSYQSLQRNAYLIGNFFASSIDLCGLLELRFRGGRPSVVYGQFNDARLVVQWLRSPVFHRLTDVVDIGILTEDVNGVFVVTLQRGACKTDKGRFWKGLAHPPRPTLNETILATVRLVGYHHHVCSIRDRSMGLGELLDGSEHHSTGSTIEQRLQVIPACRLYWRLPQ